MGEKGERRIPPPGRVVDHHTITCDDITTLLRADRCHSGGITGEGVVVGIIDSGWYAHDYFGIMATEFADKHRNLGWAGSGRGWGDPTVVFAGQNPVFGQLPDPESDTSAVSHGTGMVANMYAVAPGVRLRMYSKDKQSFLGSLEAAVEQCDVISISKAHDPASWGGGAGPAIVRYRNAFRDAKARGKIVLHASGNDGSLPWPIANCTTDLIKVGGVHARANGHLEAADYAMAHAAPRLPDICGLCGMRPGGAYIWLPGDPDRDAPGALARGWGLHSGTSSATPQVAGVVALMVQARRQNGMSALTMETAKSFLRRTAQRVMTGASADNVACSPNWTLLADAEAAVRMAVQ